MSEMLTTAQVADATEEEFSPDTIRRMCRDGQFPRARTVGGNWLIPREDVELFLSTHDRYQHGRPIYDARTPQQGAA